MKSPERRAWRVNPRAALAIGVAAAALVGIGLGLRSMQIQQKQPTLLRQAQRFARESPPRYDLAGSYLNQYLTLRPDDPDALDLKSEIFADTAASLPQVQAAIAAGDQVLRLDPSRSATRRRLVRLHLKELQYAGAEAAQLEKARLLAEALLKESDDAEAHRLAAQVLDALSTLGSGDEAAQDAAVAQYRLALARDPKDVASARSLAVLYLRRKNDPAGAEKVLDDLLAAGPTAEAHLARRAFFLARDLDDRDRRAAAEMAKAVALEPKNPDVRIVASSDALARGDVAAARAQLDAIPAAEHDTYRVRLARGLVELHEHRTDDAIEDWRQGLILKKGTDEALTFRLASVLLDLGRTNEATPLIDQYRRITGGAEPTPACRYLYALRDLKEGRPVEAISALESLRLKAAAGLDSEVDLALGKAYEAVRDDSAALDAYDSATRKNPKAIPPRLARFRILQAIRPEEAATELARGLAESPNDPDLLIAQARLELLKQARRPRERRDWRPLEKDLDRARKATPRSGPLALVESEYLAQIGRDDDSVSILAKAVQHDKRNLEVWIGYANRLAARGDAAEALLALERAAAPEAAGDQADIRVARARLQTLQGHGREAREALVKDIDKMPPAQRPIVWAALGDLYVAQKDYPSARSAYGRWVDLQPEDPKPRLFLLEHALVDGGPEADRVAEESIRALEKIGVARGLYAKIARVENLLRSTRKATVDVAKKRLDEAESLIEQIQRLAPKKRHGYLLEGMLHEVRSEAAAKDPALAREEVSKAIKAYERAIDLEGGQAVLQRLVVLYGREHDDTALERLGRERPELAVAKDRIAAEVALGLGEKDRAVKLASRVADADPDSLDARAWQAKVLATVGDPAAAEAALRDLANRKPSEAGPWQALLGWQVQRGQAKAASETVDQIKAKVKSDRPELLWARCYVRIGDLARALESYEAARAKWPGDPEVSQAVVDFYDATGRVDKAEAILRDALRRDPGARWAARSLALHLSVRGRSDPTARAEALRLVGSTPNAKDGPEDRLIRAIVLARGSDAGDRQAAAEQLERLLADLPRDFGTSAVARRVLGEIYRETGQADKARAQAEIDAREGADPRSIAAYADALIREKLWDQAEVQVKRLESFDANSVDALRLRSRVLVGRGKMSEAVALLEAYFKARQDKPEGAAVGLAVAGALIDLGPEAGAAAERLAAELARRWPATSWLLASIRGRQGQQAEFFQINAMAASHGSREAVTNTLAQVARDPDPDRVRQAESVVDAALKHSPDDPELLVKRAYLLHFLHDYEGEVRLYERALARGPADYKFLNNMAWTLCEGLGRPRQALDRIDEADRKAGILPQFLDTRGVILTRLGQLDAAIKALEGAASATQGTPSFAPTQFHLARAYQLNGRPTEAREALRRAREAGLSPKTLEPKERAELDALSAKLVAAVR